MYLWIIALPLLFQSWSINSFYKFYNGHHMINANHSHVFIDANICLLCTQISIVLICKHKSECFLRIHKVNLIRLKMVTHVCWTTITMHIYRWRVATGLCNTAIREFNCKCTRIAHQPWSLVYTIFISYSREVWGFLYLIIFCGCCGNKRFR